MYPVTWKLAASCSPSVTRHRFPGGQSGPFNSCVIAAQAFAALPVSDAVKYE